MWNDIAEFGARAASVVIPIIGMQLALHKVRSARLDKLEAKVDKLDTDFDGMVRQVAATVIEIERRFVTKPDHIEAMRLLGVSIATLTTTIGGLDGRIFDIMKERR